MPIPKPEKDEEKNDFVGRCMSFLDNEGSDLSQDARVAACNNSWKGKDEVSESKLFWTTDFSVTESGVSTSSKKKWCVIGGVALTQTISTNRRRYSIKNISENDGVEVSVFSEHRPIEDHVVGKANFYEKEGILKYEGKIRNTVKHPDIVEKAQDGLLKVSIGANDVVFTKGSDGIINVESIKINHLGLVGIAGVKDASIEYAISESAESFLSGVSEKQKGLLSETEVLPMKELEELKNQVKVLTETITMERKSRIVESILSLSPEMEKEKLMGESQEVLETKLYYEKKLQENEGDEESKDEKEEKKKQEEGKSEESDHGKEKKSEGEGEGEGTVEKEEEKKEKKSEVSENLKNIVLEGGNISMNETLYAQMNEDIRNSALR